MPQRKIPREGSSLWRATAHCCFSGKPGTFPEQGRGSCAFTFAASLLLVCVAAKIPALASRNFPVTWWLPAALFWQDALLAALAAPLFALIARRHWALWSVYILAVVYSAVNAVLLLILSSPLTLAMARATGSALRDSIVFFMTPVNIGIILGLTAVGIALPFWSRRIPSQGRSGALGMVVALLFLGPAATGRTHTDGLHRNALVAFARSFYPRVPARPVEGDWRESPYQGDGAVVDLSPLIGAASHRNVVLISLESTGAQYLAPWGGTNDPTPNLSRLAASALVFENAYAVYPESIKGLLSTLCSTYPAIDTSTEIHAREGTPSLGHVLAGAGYTNALFHSGRFMYLGMDDVVQNRGYHYLCDAGGISGNHHSSFGVDEPATVDKMLQWLEALPRAQPFFLTYLPIAGHHPYDAPERGPFGGATEMERYWNALHYGDKALGRFLSELEARGLYSNTVFVIYGDHGEAFGQHAGNYGHTLQIYEENVRVPLLIAAPGLAARPLQIPQTASLIDIAPTVLELVGLLVPAEHQGSSLLRPARRMALFFTDYSLGLVGLRDGDWKFIYEIESGRAQLFDLKPDPGEQQNVASLYAGRVAAYRERLKNWASAQRFRVTAQQVDYGRAAAGTGSSRSKTPRT